MLAFAASAMLAGIAGILLGAMRPMTPTMGSEPLVKALVVAIFGGLGSIGGTIGGAYVIGLIEAVSTYAIGLWLDAGGSLRRDDRGAAVAAEWAVREKLSDAGASVAGSSSSSTRC